MIPARASAAHTLTINAKLLSAFLLGAGAWLCWPESREWWQFGVMSVILWVGALGKLVEGLRAIIKIYTRDREIAKFIAQGRAASNSELASGDALRQAGMTDD